MRPDVSQAGVPRSHSNCKECIPVKIFIIVLIVIVAVLVGLYFLGRRMEKKQDEQQESIQANKQPVTMLVIDKKRMKFKDAPLPQAVKDQTPWYGKRAKYPIVKAKVGPQIVHLVADEQLFDEIPVKRQIKAMVSGIYIVEIKGVHGQKIEKPEKKKGFFGRTMDKIRKAGHADK